MSAVGSEPNLGARFDAIRRGEAAATTMAFRGVALVCALVLLGSSVRVLIEVTSVVGGTTSLYGLVILALVSGTVASVTLSERTAGLVALVGGAIAFAYYFNAAGVGVTAALSQLDLILSDTMTLISGLELLRILEARTWALGFAPAPVFLTWYLALRRRYALAVVPGGIALALLVLTTDAWTGVTLAGTIGGIGLVGFGELERRDGLAGQVDLLVILLAAMLLLALFVPLVPGGSSGPTVLVQGEGEGSLEGTLTSQPGESSISGAVSLSPEVRFSVESDRPAYWRTGVYDRYTGDSWVSTGETREYDGSIESPSGPTAPVVQEVTVENRMGVMPAANQPVEISEGVRQYTQVTEHGQVQPTVTLVPDDTYTVKSDVPKPNSDRLRQAGTDYPGGKFQARYVEQSDTVSDEFEARVSELTAEATNPYDAAVTIESHLKSSKGYSLSVEKPDGDVASSFLLDMQNGYCVYFATTMVQMLRAEDIPARYVTGYTSGQQIADDEWVVRGTDAHAWVEVYFPDHGWIAFDPTPSASRDAVHQDRVEQARSQSVDGVDTEASEDVPLGDDPGDGNTLEPGEGTDPDDGPDNGSDNGSANTSPNGSDGNTSPGQDPQSGGSAPDAADDPGQLLPSREQLARGAVAVLGLAAVARRLRLGRRARRELRVYWQRRREEPNDDVERAANRLETLLSRRYRPRRRGETHREYVEALARSNDVDDRVRSVLDARERAVYGDGVDRTEAASTIETVDDLVRSHLPGLHRFQ